MHRSKSLFYLTTALHVSGVPITHRQEHKTTVTTASGNRYTVLLPAAVVEELKPVWVCCGWRTPPTTQWVIRPPDNPQNGQSAHRVTRAPNSPHSG